MQQQEQGLYSRSRVSVLFPSPKSTERTALRRRASIHAALPELCPAGEFRSHVLFPSRFFLDSEPTSLSQAIVHFHAEFTGPPEGEKVSVYHQVTKHLFGTEGCPGTWNFQG